MKKVGIICAGDRELEPFLKHIEVKSVQEKALLKFYEGSISNTPVVILYSGVCKVNAAIATQILIDSFSVDIVINAGTAGAMHRDINLFDTVISTQIAYHDVADGILTEFHPWMPTIYFETDKELLRVTRELFDGSSTIHFGCMVTGEQFISDDMRDEINNKYSPLSVDMETASIAHVCYVNKIPFISIRSITDTPSHSGLENFEKNCSKASEISKNHVLTLLSNI